MAAGRKPGPQGIEFRSVPINPRHSSNGLIVACGHLTVPFATFREAKQFQQPNSETKLLAVELTMGKIEAHIGFSLNGSFRLAVAELAEGFMPCNTSSLRFHHFGRSSGATAGFFDTRAKQIYESLNLLPIASLPNAERYLHLAPYADHTRLKSPRLRKTTAPSHAHSVAEFANALTELVFALVRYLAAYLQHSGLKDLRVPLTLTDRNILSCDLVANYIAALRHTSLPSPFFEWIKSSWFALLSVPLFLPDQGHVTTPSKELAPEDLDRYREDGDDFDNSSDDPSRPILTYIEIHVIDEDGNPVNRGRYRLELTDGSIRKGTLPQDGKIRIDSIPPGNCDFKLFQMLDFGVAEDEVVRSWEWKETSVANAREEELTAQHSAKEINEPYSVSKA